MSHDVNEAVFVVDMQAGFFEDEPLSSRREELVDAVNRLTAAARRVGLPVFVITTVHSRDRSTWTLNMLDDDQGYLFAGDPTTELVEGLETQDATRVEKTRDSAWFGTDLHLRLKNLAVDRVVLAGVSTHLCIVQTARDGYAMNTRMSVITDAVATERPDYEETVLQQLVDDRQATLETVDEVIARWSSADAAS